MIVNLYTLPGDTVSVGTMTTDDADGPVMVGDVVKPLLPDIQIVTGVERWRVVALHGTEADAVACK